MPARDDAGSNYGRPGGSQNSGVHNGGVAGGMGGGFGGGGAGRNGGSNSSYGLKTGTTMKGNKQQGAPGGLAQALAQIARPKAPNVVPTAAPPPPQVQPPLPPYVEPEIPRQLSYSPGMWWNNPTSLRSQQFNPNRFPNSLDGMWQASGGWPGQGSVPPAGNTVNRTPGDVRYPGGQTVRKNGSTMPAPTGKEEIY